jgi:hypothetical protein
LSARKIGGQHTGAMQTAYALGVIVIVLAIAFYVYKKKKSPATPQVGALTAGVNYHACSVLKNAPNSTGLFLMVDPTQQSGLIIESCEPGNPKHQNVVPVACGTAGQYYLSYYSSTGALAGYVARTSGATPGPVKLVAPADPDSCCWTYTTDGQLVSPDGSVCLTIANGVPTTIAYPQANNQYARFWKFTALSSN